MIKVQKGKALTCCRGQHLAARCVWRVGGPSSCHQTYLGPMWAGSPATPVRNQSKSTIIHSNLNKWQISSENNVKEAVIQLEIRIIQLIMDQVGSACTIWGLASHQVLQMSDFLPHDFQSSCSLQLFEKANKHLHVPSIFLANEEQIPEEHARQATALDYVENCSVMISILFHQQHAK